MKSCIVPNLFIYDWHSVFKKYKSIVKPNMTVLEIGASNTSNTKQLAMHCKSLIGVELSPKRTPLNFSNVKYITGDWQKLSSLIKTNSIDIAVSTHVIEHVPDDLLALNELYSVLKKDGVAIINTPNRKRLTRTIIELFTGKRKFPYWEHEREYIEKDLINLIHKSKFKHYTIKPVVLGLHGGPIYIYLESVPAILRPLSNFWEIHLTK
ncbi:hypothetical protein COW99_00490 [Candidatus Roizmanbacteria bacterium CG22_combo_CG10-13_8_21_14_all_38_20]|uniref:Methyltransferase type 11 domain-containing protein n=1 Tax=Candidatus Roizmanbacteria bacterium CG22_combo_CG10-13_8_21_14_all_38_20 TaxID=1974862 RepID=A0A2H0BX91_9BACT|nr:class I SAM-dependent methyltransferase [Candidatus Microgenomates bacterium]PIP62149.1 MAG: hypothetical protein COW99_00490 [Candidatus Roizmanbacteria bacterium CG22_combo_CG10-13_8_21_14_all_38_20]PJC30913.1 MAG: hypothetical protein CO050_05095 [Candidatus Roizmanbacteria bacterium CG_4_9_14_0_2_um_filter_38_17]